MKNKIFKKILILISIAIFGIFNTAFATLSVEIQVDVPMSCAVADTDGVIHNYPEEGSLSPYLGICALDASIKNNSLSDVQLSNQFPSMGLFITSMSGVTADPNSQYWAIYQNGSFANSGITSLPVVAGDSIVFKLNDFTDTNLGDQVTLHINSLNTPPPPPTGNSGLGGIVEVASNPTVVSSAAASEPIYLPVVKPAFDLQKAFAFLILEQKENGSFGEDLYTDWTTLAIASGNYQEQTIKLVKYFGTSKLENAILTDYERRAMALLALGLNPSDINGENYVEKIINSFDGKQFGDLNEDNDDIFALIVLQNVGYTKDEKIINDDISFILQKQKENGSFDESVDMTGAAIESLSAFPLIEGVKESLEKAKEFLKQNQKDDGGWGNVSSTAWALEGIAALNEKPEDWLKNGNTPLDYLAISQDTDGGIKSEILTNKIWETAYVTSILSGKTWNQIMQKFEKQPEKKKEITTKIPKKIAKKEIVTAIVINAFTPLATPTQAEQTETIQKKNWLRNIFDKIFSIF